MAMKGDAAVIIREYQKRLDRALRENEISVLQYWKERLERIAAMKPEGIASLLLELKKLAENMDNRIKILKKDLR